MCRSDGWENCLKLTSKRSKTQKKTFLVMTVSLECNLIRTTKQNSGSRYQNEISEGGTKQKATRKKTRRKRKRSSRRRKRIRRRRRKLRKEEEKDDDEEDDEEEKDGAPPDPSSVFQCMDRKCSKRNRAIKMLLKVCGSYCRK